MLETEARVLINTKLTKLFMEFFESEKSSGIVLIICTVSAIMIANSPFGENFLDFWHIKAGFDAGDLHLKYSMEHWINDGLMAIFFLLIGLEIERELYIGELSSPKNASLPIFAAVGGMLTPALLYLFFNYGTATQRGFGIPMATDIAFALGALSLLGKKIPAALKVFLTALAIIDDLGAIIVIAIFYVSDFSLFYLLIALGIFGGLLVLNRLRVYRLAFYLIPGTIMWYCFLQSGVHATLAGVLLAFAIPFVDGDGDSPSYKLQHFLHRPVALVVMPLFALANTGIVLAGNWVQGLVTPNAIGIFTGLVIGKPLGIILFTFSAVKLRLSRLPDGVSWKHVVGAGFLGGIGFTMSIFITLLAFGNTDVAQTSKIAVLIGSLSSGIIGFLILNKQTLEEQQSKTYG
jgi:NhaA family Na+:H+ antiporter